MSERILVTHVGSLPRPPALAEALIRRENGEPVDGAALERAVDDSVRSVVAQQRAAGVDIGNDGEQSRAGFQTYVTERMDGFAGSSNRRTPVDYAQFPKFAEMMARRMQRVARTRNAPQCVSPLRYRGTEAIDAECDRVLSAGKSAPGGAFAAMFMTAPSPGIVATTMHNAHYDSDEAYLSAIAGELHKEYAAILDKGLLLQIDAPDLAMERCIMYQDLSDAEFRDKLTLHVDMLNRAIDRLDPARIRLHCCWGNWDGPHVHDVPLSDVLPHLYEARVGGLSIPFANPRHQHEVAVLERMPPPPHMTILPGVIDSTNNYVEHPEGIAARLVAVARAIGDPARVIASTDCGFGTFAGFEFVAEDVLWAKMAACREGADLAARRLHGR
jgi:5-methyltetrahydropteroyltriglutamate--homocysteine methyltransferase